MTEGVTGATIRRKMLVDDCPEGVHAACGVNKVRFLLGGRDKQAILSSAWPSSSILTNCA